VTEERDLHGDLEEIILDCGYINEEIPTEGPGSTYVVMITPFEEQVFGDDDGEVGTRLGYRGQGLDGSCSVRIYAVPDAIITPKRREVLRRANVADLSAYDPYDDDALEEADDPDAAEAALKVERWVTKGKWVDYLAFNYNNDPLTYGGPGAPDRPTDIVTIMLPGSSYDEFADRY